MAKTSNSRHDRRLGSEAKGGMELRLAESGGCRATIRSLALHKNGEEYLQFGRFAAKTGSSWEEDPRMENRERSSRRIASKSRVKCRAYGETRPLPLRSYEAPHHRIPTLP